jgi:putative transposase
MPKSYAPEFRCRVDELRRRAGAAQPPSAPRLEDERLAVGCVRSRGEHPRWGWKTAHQILLREGWTLNRKRTRRVWRQEGLRRPVKARKRRCLPGAPKQRLRASSPNDVWAVDFQFDETSDQRRIKLCNIVDELTRRGARYPCW